MDSKQQQASYVAPVQPPPPLQQSMQPAPAAAAYYAYSQPQQVYYQPPAPGSVPATRYSQYRFPNPGEPLPAPMQGDEGLFSISVLFMFLSLLVTPFISTLLAWFTVNLPKRRAAGIIGSGVGSTLISIGLLAGYIIYYNLYVDSIVLNAKNTFDFTYNENFYSIYLVFRALFSLTLSWSIAAIILGSYLLSSRKGLERNEMIRQQYSVSGNGAAPSA